MTGKASGVGGVCQEIRAGEGLLQGEISQRAAIAIMMGDHDVFAGNDAREFGQDGGAKGIDVLQAVDGRKQIERRVEREGRHGVASWNMHAPFPTMRADGSLPGKLNRRSSEGHWD